MDNQCCEVQEERTLLFCRKKRAPQAQLFQIKVLPRKRSDGNCWVFFFNGLALVVSGRLDGLFTAEHFVQHIPSERGPL